MSLTPPVWSPASVLADPGSPVLAAMVRRPQQQWGAAPHAAAALAWKAYSWCVLQPVVGALLDDRPVPRLDLGNTEVILLEERPYLKLRVVDPAPLAGYGVLERVGADVIDGHLGRVADALSVATRVGVRTLWGSVAESVSYPLLAAGRPDLAARLLDAWSLAGLLDPVTGALAEPGHPFRRTCCLAVTVPGLGVCATCPVNRRVAEGSAPATTCSS